MSSPGRTELTLQEALKKGDLSAFQKAIARGEDVNGLVGSEFICHRTLLVEACNSGSYKFVKSLLKAPGIDVNKQEGGIPRAPIHAAVDSGNIGILTLLLSDSRVDVNLLLCQ